MYLSFLTDFCSSWLLWWILPFLLGLLLGFILWRHYKEKYQGLENQINAQKAEVENLKYNLRKTEKDLESKDFQVDKLKDKNTSMQLELSQTKKSLLNIKSQVVQTTAKEDPNKKADKNSLKNFKSDLKHKETTEKVEAKSVDKPENEIVNPYPKLESTQLQIIEGIGPRLESILKENGLHHWKDVAAKSKGELRSILDNYGGKYSIIDPSGWPKQAKLAKKRKWDALIALQSEDGSDSKLRKFLNKLGYK